MRQTPRNTLPILSLAMIVKNEAETIARVLHDARTFCDEMIVVDTGSTDNTIAIAQSCGATVYHFDWIDDFAAARNEALKHCRGDWMIWLDADDTISPQEQEKFKALKQNELRLENPWDVIFIQYRHFDPNEPAVCTLEHRRERIIRLNDTMEWDYPVHECIEYDPERTLDRLDIAIEHRTLAHKFEGKKDRNLNILQKAIAAGDTRPRNIFYYANELRDHGRYLEAIEQYQRYCNLSVTVNWEKYYSLLHMGRCYKQLNLIEEALASWGIAIATDSQRAEAYIDLGEYHFTASNWSAALPLFLAASCLKKPDTGFIEESAYQWLPDDYLSVCYSNLGMADEALKHTMKAFPNNPDPARLKRNVHWILDHLVSPVGSLTEQADQKGSQ